MHFVVCISGFSGAGKDECASQLVKQHRAVHTGLADPGKRHMADAYGFTEQQLFGPSHLRNAGDVRIPKNAFYERGLERASELPNGIVDAADSKYRLDASQTYWVYTSDAPDGKRPWHLSRSGRFHVFVREGDPEFWLSPREALQQYLEKMNQLDVYTWIRKGVQDHLLLATGNFGYHRMRGLVRPGDVEFTRALVVDSMAKDKVTCFSDFRHICEVRYIRDLSRSGSAPFRPVIIRVKRPSVPIPPYDHRSETEQVKIRDAAFDAIIHNDLDLAHLYAQVDEVMRRAMAGDLQPKPWSDQYVMDDRKPEQGYAP